MHRNGCHKRTDGTDQQRNQGKRNTRWKQNFELWHVLIAQHDVFVFLQSSLLPWTQQCIEKLKRRYAWAWGNLLSVCDKTCLTHIAKGPFLYEQNWGKLSLFWAYCGPRDSTALVCVWKFCQKLTEASVTAGHRALVARPFFCHHAPGSFQPSRCRHILLSSGGKESLHTTAVWILPLANHHLVQHPVRKDHQIWSQQCFIFQILQQDIKQANWNSQRSRIGNPKMVASVQKYHPSSRANQAHKIQIAWICLKRWRSRHTMLCLFNHFHIWTRICWVGKFTFLAKVLRRKIEIASTVSSVTTRNLFNHATWRLNLTKSTQANISTVAMLKKPRRMWLCVDMSVKLRCFIDFCSGIISERHKCLVPQLCRWNQETTDIFFFLHWTTRYTKCPLIWDPRWNVSKSTPGWKTTRNDFFSLRTSRRKMWTAPPKHYFLCF